LAAFDGTATVTASGLAIASGGFEQTGQAQVFATS
jgi:hypothetical protein